MDLTVWNSQGGAEGNDPFGRWNVMWTNWITPRITPQNDDVLGLTIEAGWAPWIKSDEVSLNQVYPLDIDSTRYNVVTAGTSAFCQGVESSRRRWAYWVPWVGNLNAMNTNSRCSMGGLILPKFSQLSGTDRFEFPGHKRPVIRVQLSRANTTNMSVFLVHLISGYWKKANDEMADLTSQMSTLIPESTPAVVVGDMNLDLQTITLTLPDKWRILKTGVATQQSGGELDYALLYDPTGKFPGASAAVVQQYKSGTNGSDHSVMRYSV